MPRPSSGQQGALESTVVQRLRRELALEKMKSAACQKQLEQASMPSEASTWAAHVPWVEAVESAKCSVWLRVSSSALLGLTGEVLAAHRRGVDVRVLVDDQQTSMPGLVRSLLILVQESVPSRVTHQLFLMRSREKGDRWGLPELKLPVEAPSEVFESALRGSAPGCSPGAYVVLDVGKRPEGGPW